MSDYTGLTDAEREALEDEDLDQAQEPVDDASNEEASEDVGEDAAEDKSAEAELESSQPAVTQQSFSVPTADIDQIDQSLKELQDKRDALEGAYESGDSESTYSEHRAALREVDQAIQNLAIEKAEARAVQKLNQAYQLEWWTREVNAFKREALREGIDYDKDEKMGAEWDRAVQFLGQDPANASQDAQWFLKEAHEMVKARFRIAPKTEAPQKTNRVDEALAARRRRQGEIPPSLSGLPEAGSQDERESEFSHLESLKGDALERALAKLSPEQADRFLTS